MSLKNAKLDFGDILAASETLADRWLNQYAHNSDSDSESDEDRKKREAMWNELKPRPARLGLGAVPAPKTVSVATPATQKLEKKMKRAKRQREEVEEEESADTKPTMDEPDEEESRATLAVKTPTHAGPVNKKMKLMQQALEEDKALLERKQKEREKLKQRNRKRKEKKRQKQQANSTLPSPQA